MPAMADEIDLNGVETQSIQLPQAKVIKKQSLVVSDEQVLEELISMQMKKI